MSDAAIVERRGEDPRFKKLFAEVSQLKKDQLALSTKIDQNTATMLDIKKNTEDIVEAWDAITGGLKVLGFLGTCAKYVTYFAAAIGATGGAWYALTHWGASPTPPIDIPK